MRETKTTIVTFLIIVLLLLFIQIYSTKPVPEPEVIEVVITEIITEKAAHYTREKVMFTSYNGSITSTGHTPKDFNINSEGWYTYQGYVVIATATHICVQVENGACGKYNDYKDTHHYFTLMDVITIHINNKDYEAIILDSCGACNWDEDYQRVDIFIAPNTQHIGKKKGAITY